MKISVIMIDGGFRDNVYSAEYFSRQDFDENEYEVIWVDYFDKPNLKLKEIDKVKVITLNKTDEYHSSYCFNKGIEVAQGELLVIPDADQIVKPDFLTRIWEKHKKCNNLVLYIYRYDEIEEGYLNDLSFEELDKKCILKNPLNYGGCLAVRKKWLMEINGYEMHPIFRSGFHANGLDIYTRFKSLGLPIQWDNELKLYHPWHPTTLAFAPQYEPQKKMIKWKHDNLHYTAINGIDESKNLKDRPILDIFNQFDIGASEGVSIINRQLNTRFKSLIKRIFGGW